VLGHSCTGWFAELWTQASLNYFQLSGNDAKRQFSKFIGTVQNQVGSVGPLVGQLNFTVATDWLLVLALN
jgi:hypothetical protein